MERHIKTYLNSIEEKISEIEKTLAELKKSATPVAPDNALGRLTRMEMMQAQKIAKANYDKACARLEALRHAKKKINTEPDEYGLCLSCEEPIGDKRLERYPESTLCVKCAK